MEYYVILSKKYNDGTADKKSIYVYQTIEEAVASFHSQLGGAVGASTIDFILCLVINSVGGVLRSEYWKAEKTTEESTEETAEESAEETTA